MAGKITTEVRYRGESYMFIYENNDLKLFISTDRNFAIIVNSDDEVLFQIEADTSQGSAYMVNLGTSF